MKQRIYKLDNFRAVLIILVVFGHACQFLTFPQNLTGFKLIYTFHMPAFVFLTGICSKPGDPKKVVRRFLLPYAVFQVIFYFFLKLFIDPETTFSLITPIRHLWYLLSVAIWKSLLPLFDTGDRKKQLLFVCLSFAAALAVGFLTEFGKVLSLSRTVLFFPFFLIGYYLKDLLTDPKGICTKAPAKFIALAAAVIYILVILLLKKQLPANTLFGIMPYSPGKHGFGWRALTLLLASLITGALFILMPEKKVPLLSTLGTRTMPVFLFHMFVMLYLNHYADSVPHQLWFALAVSAACVIVFAQKPFVWLASPLTELQKLREKKKENEKTGGKVSQKAGK